MSISAVEDDQQFPILEGNVLCTSGANTESSMLFFALENQLRCSWFLSRIEYHPDICLVTGGICYISSWNRAENIAWNNERDLACFCELSVVTPVSCETVHYILHSIQSYSVQAIHIESGLICLIACRSHGDSEHTVEHFSWLTLRMRISRRDENSWFLRFVRWNDADVVSLTLHAIPVTSCSLARRLVFSVVLKSTSSFIIIIYLFVLIFFAFSIFAFPGDVVVANCVVCSPWKSRLTPCWGQLSLPKQILLLQLSLLKWLLRARHQVLVMIPVLEGLNAQTCRSREKPQ